MKLIAHRANDFIAQDGDQLYYVDGEEQTAERISSAQAESIMSRGYWLNPDADAEKRLREFLEATKLTVATGGKS
jgi:hypothetical protein